MQKGLGTMTVDREIVTVSRRAALSSSCCFRQSVTKADQLSLSQVSSHLHLNQLFFAAAAYYGQAATVSRARGFGTEVSTRGLAARNESPRCAEDTTIVRFPHNHGRLGSSCHWVICCFGASSKAESYSVGYPGLCLGLRLDDENPRPLESSGLSR
jgi:hypothetical protein